MRVSWAALSAGSAWGLLEVGPCWGAMPSGEPGRPSSMPIKWPTLPCSYDVAGVCMCIGDSMSSSMHTYNWRCGSVEHEVRHTTKRDPEGSTGKRSQDHSDLFQRLHKQIPRFLRTHLPEVTLWCGSLMCRLDWPHHLHDVRCGTVSMEVWGHVENAGPKDLPAVHRLATSACVCFESVG